MIQPGMNVEAMNYFKVKKTGKLVDDEDSIPGPEIEKADIKEPLEKHSTDIDEEQPIDQPVHQTKE